MKEQKFYICKHCGNLVAMVKESGVPLICCGEEMHELVPGTVDAAVEKHVPVYKAEGNKVTVEVGSVEHPMLPEHYIQWIWLKTKFGGQLAKLKPETKPEAVFALADGDEVEAVYEYCNLHGLWRA